MYPSNMFLSFVFCYWIFFANFLFNSALQVFHDLILHFYNSNVDGLFITFFCFRWFTAIVKIGRVELGCIHVFLLFVLVHAKLFFRANMCTHEFFAFVVCFCSYGPKSASYFCNLFLQQWLGKRGANFTWWWWWGGA